MKKLFFLWVTWIQPASTNQTVNWMTWDRGGPLVRLETWWSLPCGMLTCRIRPLTWYSYEFESITKFQQKEIYIKTQLPT